MQLRILKSESILKFWLDQKNTKPDLDFFSKIKLYVFPTGTIIEYGFRKGSKSGILSPSKQRNRLIMCKSCTRWSTKHGLVMMYVQGKLEAWVLRVESLASKGTYLWGYFMYLS